LGSCFLVRASGLINLDSWEEEEEKGKKEEKKRSEGGGCPPCLF